MTTNHHTPIPSSPKQPANAATINGPLGELDAAITDHETRISAEEAKITLSHVPNEFVNSEGECSVPAGTGSSGHVIQEEGVDLPQRAKLNFKGDGVSVTNTSLATEININRGGLASDVIYDPLESTDWDVEPGEAASALDELAERVRVLETPVEISGVLEAQVFS
jgi:hypothetical protein